MIIYNEIVYKSKILEVQEKKDDPTSVMYRMDVSFKTKVNITKL